MAALPFPYTDIITPYNVWGEESSSILQSINQRVYVTRRGGYRYKMTLSLRPYTLLSEDDSAQFDLLRTFLTKYPQFSVPMLNNQLNTFDDLGVPVTVEDMTGDDTYNVPGAYKVRIPGTGWSGQFYPGQYIKFSDKDKVYQVEEQNGQDIVLAQRLRQTLNPVGINPAADIIYEEADGINLPFNGVMCGMVNEDFGYSNGQVTDGVLGQIGPLSLIENI